MSGEVEERVVVRRQHRLRTAAAASASLPLRHSAPDARYRCGWTTRCWSPARRDVENGIPALLREAGLKVGTPSHKAFAACAT
jgi:hypothetical protein